MFDVIIIGGGVVGCATARALSKYELNVGVIEREVELAMGASKANSGIVHAGFDCEVGTLKAKLNVQGNALYKTLHKELDFPYKNNGSMVLALSENETGAVQELYERGVANGVPDIQILTKAEVLAMEPNICDSVVCALYAPSGGIVSPYEATQAFGENAFANGVQFFLGEKVLDIRPTEEGYGIRTDKDTYQSKMVINCGGLYGDEIHNMVSTTKYTITPRKGEYLLFDSSTKGYIHRTLFQVPSEFGKGVLVTPTVHGNLLIGPSAEFIEDKEEKKTTAETLENVQEKALRTVKALPKNKLITSFTGLRANLPEDDFCIGEETETPGFINAIGINSPGLSAAPAIALYIAEMVKNRLHPKEKEDFISERKGITFLRDCSPEQQDALVKQNPQYGKIICRCETVTEAEIVEAIHRPLGAVTVDGVKRMTRSGMGRCQGGFCSSKVMEILARELHKDIQEITKFGKESNILMKNEG